MKRLYVIVEGQTEQQFVKELLLPYLQQFGIYVVTPVLIRTSKNGRGGFVNYAHLKNDVLKLLKSSQDDFVVSMFVDFFRMPEVPFKERWENISSHPEQVAVMEQCIAADINDRRFIPYIQLHEFEALLFSNNDGFSAYFSEKEALQTQEIISSYANPEDINTTPDGAPSKRLLTIKNNYDKVIEGNLIALEIGIKNILARCPRFAAWVDILIKSCK